MSALLPHRLLRWLRHAGAALVLGSAIPLGASALPDLSAGHPPDTAGRLSPSDDAFLEELEHASFQFFVEQSHPVTGLVMDRASADGGQGKGMASIAACGFALTAYAIGAERGWIERPAAIERCRTQLRFLATKAPRVHGFFYHFMEPATGARAWKCELSTIDTGLFLAGAILVREYFHDPEITELVNRIYRELDWDWFLNGGATFAMGWRDETGFSRFRWSSYSELMMLTLLGLGESDHPIRSELWSSWLREPVDEYAGYRYIQHPSLFVHQFTHAYVQFNGLRDAYADYYRNSVLATLAQRRFCADLSKEFPTWNEQLWGVTASDSATGYKGGWGGPPRTLGSTDLDGTIVPCAAAGSLPFTPEESLQMLRFIRTMYGDRIWRRYGFVDAFNPETGWVNPDVIGIDVGIQLLQAENARTNFVHSVFMRAPEVRRALARAGFLPTDRNLPTAQRDRIWSFAREAWTTLDGAPLGPDTVGLQLSATVAARTLGLVSGADASVRASTLLRSAVAPSGGAALAQYAAGLILLRQAFPALFNDAARRLEAIDWSRAALANTQLGSAERLAVFFQIATGVRPSKAWNALERVPVAVKPVYALSPAKVADQMLPGLWLDERGIITGASAAQLTYAELILSGAPLAPRPGNLLLLSAALEYFPAIGATVIENGVGPGLLATAPIAERSALLLSAANLLGSDRIRTYFQQDPIVQAGRAAIPDFAAAEFGQTTSTYWRDELAGPPPVFPRRETVATAADSPTEQWHWLQMSGAEFRDSSADVRPGDPELSMRFAFTWDAEALYLHAVVVDGLPGFVPKPGEHNGVELFVDPRIEGLAWLGNSSFQFVYRTDGKIHEAFHRRTTAAKIKPIAGGYTVEARIAWTELGVTPRPGLTLAVSPAVIAEGRAEWEPALKLNWSYHRRADGRINLGLLRLQ